MRSWTMLPIAALALAAPACHARPASDAALAKVIAGPQRSAANRARDVYRHPQETLAFFAITPKQKVVELWPGAGWYSEILAPYLAAHGKLTLATPAGKANARVDAMIAASPDLYAKVDRARFPFDGEGTKVPDASVDLVLTFRNVHNWRFGGADKAQAAFNAIFAMLKPGGTLGVVEHRLPEAMASTLEEKSGYLKESTVIAYALDAGFKLAGASEINANPKDTHDWEKGVWTLPPVLQLGDTDRAKYLAIGESDRMTLRFIKPAK